MIKRPAARRGVGGLLKNVFITAAVLAIGAGTVSLILSKMADMKDQADEVINTALFAVSSNLSLKGDVTGYNSSLNDNNSIGRIELNLVNSGDPIDLTPNYLLDNSGALIPNNRSPGPIRIVFKDNYLTIPDCAWTVKFIDLDKNDFLLEDNEKALITVWLHEWDGVQWCTGTGPFLGDDHVDNYHDFVLEVRPEAGTPLYMELRAPAHLRPTNTLN